MKHSGRAIKAAARLLVIELIIMLVILAAGALAIRASGPFWGFAGAVVALWAVFTLFTLYFFRDPDARVPTGANLVLAPGHGKVDAIGRTTETAFMGGECQRVSIFLSVFDVHVQNAPISGKVTYFKYTAGKFLNALRADSAIHNENVLLGFEANEPHGLKVGVRLIAGVLARRIVPFVQQGEEVERGDRIGLIQFGSRADLYLPANAKIKVQLNDRAVAGETVVAVLE